MSIPNRYYTHNLLHKAFSAFKMDGEEIPGTKVPKILQKSWSICHLNHGKMSLFRFNKGVRLLENTHDRISLEMTSETPFRCVSRVKIVHDSRSIWQGCDLNGYSKIRF